MVLNKRDKNRIYKAIEKKGFDPAEFQFEDDISGGGDRVVITHNSGSTFNFGPRAQPSDSEMEFLIRIPKYTYSFDVVEGIARNGTAGDIDVVTTLYIPDWLDEIRETVGAPDLWEELRRGRRLLAQVQRESANTPFSVDEQRQITAQLEAIKTQVREQFELTSEQIAEVNEKLNEAAEASKRMGRKDWLVYFLGTITALIISATVTAGVGEHIFITVIQGVAHLFTGGTGPLPIPPKIMT